MKEIFNAIETKAFIKACFNISKFIDCNREIPPDIQAEHDQAVNNYRYLLYKLNVKPLIPKWRYSNTDKTTWKYLNVHAMNRRYKGEIYNENFKYKELL